MTMGPTPLPGMGTISACEQGERTAMEQEDAAQWEHRATEHDERMAIEQDDSGTVDVAAISVLARDDRMIPDPRFC